MNSTFDLESHKIVLKPRQIRNKMSFTRVNHDMYTLVAFDTSQTSPGFLRVCSTSLMKPLWEKEKLLIMSNFSLSDSIFFCYRFSELSAIFYQI